MSHIMLHTEYLIPSDNITVLFGALILPVKF